MKRACRAMRRPSLAAALAACALLVPAALLAHTEPYSHLEIHADPAGLSGTLTAHMVDLAHEAGLAVPESLLDARYDAIHRAALLAVLDSHLQLEADGRRVRPQWGTGVPVPDRRSVQFAWREPRAGEPGAITLAAPLFPYDPPHETFVNVFERGAIREQAIVDHAHPTLTVYTGTAQGLGSVARTFVAQGIHHIFIGPDHILFIIGLLLLGGSVWRLLKIVTAFTIAHTVTLVLAALNVVTLPSRIVEPAIALSIVAVGIDSLRSLRTGADHRAVLAFGFGFVHGFGFASVLREFGLPASALGVSLASFNVGVEIGQACIVLLAAPIIAWLRVRRPALAAPALATASGLVVVAGAWWFVQRVWLGGS